MYLHIYWPYVLKQNLPMLSTTNLQYNSTTSNYKHFLMKIIDVRQLALIMLYSIYNTSNRKFNLAIFYGDLYVKYFAQTPTWVTLFCIRMVLSPINIIITSRDIIIIKIPCCTQNGPQKEGYLRLGRLRLPYKS